MKKLTTKKEALKIYKVILWIDPFNYSRTGSEATEIIKGLQRVAFVDNLEDLTHFIKEVYESTEEIKKDTLLLRHFTNIFLCDGRNKKIYNDFDLFNKYMKKLLQE